MSPPLLRRRAALGAVRFADEAKSFARQNFPAVILERVDGADGRVAWHEILRFDWRWDEARGEPVIALY